MFCFLRPLMLAAACLSAVAVPVLPAAATERDSFLDERPGFAEPLRFRDERGGAFRPRALIVRGAGGAMAAKLPGAATAENENRVDFSGTPVIGPLFGETLDVASAREGALVGPVYRVGDTLVVDASAASAEVVNRSVALTTNIPRYGAVSYRVGRLNWTPVTPPTGVGTLLGSAHLVDGALVVASRGGEPAWPSLEAMFKDLF